MGESGHLLVQHSGVLQITPFKVVKYEDQALCPYKCMIGLLGIVRIWGEFAELPFYVYPRV